MPDMFLFVHKYDRSSSEKKNKLIRVVLISVRRKQICLNKTFDFMFANNRGIFYESKLATSSKVN